MTLPDTLIRFRDTILAIVPRWLRRTRPIETGETQSDVTGTSYGLMVTVGVLYDALADAAVAAVKMSYPGVYSAETLNEIGAQRKIPRGLTEPDASYAARLEDWRAARKRKGTRWASLQQLQAAFAPTSAVVLLIDNDGTVHQIDANGDYSYTTSVTWDWDGHPEYVSRFWIVVDNTDVGLVPNVPTWDAWGAASNWNFPRRLWDFYWNPMPSTLRDIVETWRPPNSYCDCIIIVNDAEFWNEPPDGDWDVIENRSTYAYYATGTDHA